MTEPVNSNGPEEGTPDEQVDLESAGAGATNPPGESGENEPRERRPRVFGKGGWIGVVLPFAIYLGGISMGGYFESKRDTAHLKPIHDKLIEKCDQVDAYLETLEPEKAQDWREYLKWKEMSDSFRDANHEQTPELMDQAKNRLYGDRPGLNSPVFVELREEAESYIDYWSEYEAVIKGEKLPAGHANYGDEEKPISEIAYDRWYPKYYVVVVAAATLAALIGFRWYIIAPLNLSWLSVGVGVVGFFVWIGFYWLDNRLLGIGTMFPPSRAAYNPYRELAHDPTWMKQFLVIRFFGLVALVPLIEEFFLRGFLMRYIDDPDWDEIPLGEAGTWALVGIPIYAAMTHPNELVSAVIWFSMVTWLYLRTKSIWNCVIAHAVTNLMLGIYVVNWGKWELW